MLPPLRSATAIFALALAGACSGGSPPPPARAAKADAPVTPGAPALAPSAVAPAAAARTGGSTALPAPADEGRPCGALGCRAFSTPRAAFDFVLRENPRVLAIGESHAQKASPRVPSATERFREQLLAALAGRAKGMVIELLLPDKRCQQAEVKAVEKRQEAVTKPQAETNQNEFLALGQSAKKLGIVPQPLVPSCEELRAVLSAGTADIASLLTLIANITARETFAMLDAGDPQKAVITYGGLVHNDLVPRPGREAWSFGPRIAERTGNGYVELDLIVPEFMRPEPPWTNLPFYPHYDLVRDGAETRLFEPSPRSFVLVFPRTPNQNLPE